MMMVKADINSLKNKKVSFSGITLKIGPFILEIIKFFMYIIYTIST